MGKNDFFRDYMIGYVTDAFGRSNARIGVQLRYDGDTKDCTWVTLFAPGGEAFDPLRLTVRWEDLKRFVEHDMEVLRNGEEE